MSWYTVYVTPAAWDEARDLPGHVRQRIRRMIATLADEPRPAESKALVIPASEVIAAQDITAPVEDQPLVPSYELRRIRLDRWRIVYAITETDRVIDVLAIRKRPPYDYGDLERLLSEM